MLEHRSPGPEEVRPAEGRSHRLVLSNARKGPREIHRAKGTRSAARKDSMTNGNASIAVMGIAMKPLPSAIDQFVKAQKTIAITELWERDAESAASPYGSHWYRAVAAMLRSGRVAAKDSGFPNRTDINRICKEAN